MALPHSAELRGPPSDPRVAGMGQRRDEGDLDSKLESEKVDRNKGKNENDGVTSSQKLPTSIIWST